MLFRATSDYEDAPAGSGSGYIFGIRAYDYLIGKRVDGSFTILQAWTDCGHINPPPEWNTLKVTASGSSLTFFINGNQVASLNDSSLNSGRIGVWGYTGPDYNNTHHFDEISVTAPQLPGSSGSRELGTVPSFQGNPAAVD